MAYDSLGRDVGSVSAKDLLGGVGPAKPFGKPREDEGRLAAAVEKLVGIFGPVADEALEFFQKVVGSHVAMSSRERRSAPRPGPTVSDKDGLDDKAMKDLLSDQTKDFSDNFKILDKLAQKGLKKGSIFVDNWAGNQVQMKMMNQQSFMVQLLGQMTRSMNKMAGLESQSVNLLEMDKEGEVNEKNLGLEDALEHFKRDQGRTKTDLNDYRRRRLFGEDDPVVQLQKLMSQWFSDPTRTAHLKSYGVASFATEHEGRSNPMARGLLGGWGTVKGDLAAANSYQKVVAEVAYVTEGITHQTAKQQAAYRATEETADAAVSSGLDRLQIEQQYVKLLRLGYRSQKDTVKVTKTGANLATMIGSNFEATADFANELHMSLGLSAGAVQDIARGMQQTARSSKVSGDALLGAAQAAKPFLESMRNAGTLTAGTTKNMIDLQASFQKFGVAGNFQDLFAGMTSPNAVLSAPTESQNLMAIMGGSLVPFMSGQMAADKGLQRQGMSNLSAHVGGITGKDLSQLAQMSEEDLATFINDRWQVNLQLKGQTGKELGELVKGFKAFQEATKSFEDKMTEVNKKLKSATLTEEERTKLLKQQSDMVEGKRGDLAQRSVLGLEGAGSLAEGLARMRQNQTTMREFGEAGRSGVLGEGFDVASLQTDQGMKDALIKSMTDSHKRSADVLTKSADLMDDRFIVKGFETKLRAAMGAGDTDKIVQLQKQVLEAQEAATSATLADTDPARAAAKGLNSLNAEFAKYSANSLMYLKVIAGASLIQGTGIFSLMTGAFSAVPWRALGAAGKGLGKVFGGGGKVKEMGGLGAFAKGARLGIKEGLGLDRLGAKLFGKKAVKGIPGALPVPGVFPGIGAGVRGFAGAQRSKLRNFLATNPYAVAAHARGSAFATAARARLSPVTAAVAKRLAPVGNYVGEHMANVRGMGGRFAERFSQRAGANGLGTAAAKGLKEAVFKFAEVQEKIPLWGRFAKRFGAGKTIASKTLAGMTGVAGAGAGASLKTLGVVASEAALPLMVFMTAMDGVGQAMKTGARAATIFNSAQGAASSTERAAAENAGFLTGVLNSLTFGIFDHWIGATGTLTDSLAKLIHDFPLLNAALSVLMIPLKFLYGLFWGLVAIVEEVFKGLWDGLVLAFAPVNEMVVVLWDGLEELWGVMLDLYSPIKDIFGEFKAGSGWVDGLIYGMRLLGKALGWVLKAVGWLIGSVLQVLVPVLKFLVETIVWVAKAISTVLKPFRGGMNAGITKATASSPAYLWGGGLTSDVARATAASRTYVWGGGLTSDVARVTAASSKYIWGLLVSGFHTAVEMLPKMLYKVFVSMPIMLVSAAAGLGAKVVEVFSTAGKQIWSAVTGLFSGLGKKIMDLVYAVPGIDWVLGPRPVAPPAPGGAPPAVPGLAGGGVVQTPGLVFAGESGPELVMPLEQFANMVSRVSYGADAALGMLAGGGNEAVVSRPLSDVHSRIKQDYASREPSAATVAGSELDTIAKLTEKQVSLMMVQIEELREIKNALQPSADFGDSGPGPMSRTRSKPRSSTNYFGLPFGGYGGNASKGYVNDGVT